MNMQVDFLTPGLVRIRKFPGATPPEQPLERYGFFRTDWPEVATTAAETPEGRIVSSDLLSVVTDRRSGCLSVLAADGRELLREHEPGSVGEHGFAAKFVLPAEREFYGLGDQTRERLQHRGSKNDLWVRNVTGYIPIPLFLTNDGFGVLVNTTRRLIVDLGHASPDWFGFAATGGILDYYVLWGPSLPEIFDVYTALTGKPPLPPKWAMGLWFISRTQANDREFLEDCYHFRQDGIPCDAISLEPGWMEKNYDFSIRKDWSKERFPVPGYDRNPGRYTFLRAARRMGFKPGLWLCCDYDLSWEAERRAKAALPAQEETIIDLGFEQDQHFDHIRRMDDQTDPEVSWFEHLKDFVDQGVDYFKQDGASQVVDHPDRLFGNGMRDDEMHNLNPLLYSQQMYQGFLEHTGRRPFGFTVGGWAGLQRWTATWTGDTGGEERPLVALLNLAMSGHGLSTVDMEVTTKQGIHFGFLQPWSQLNSWNYFRHPWYQGQFLQGVFTDYARLRYRLIPYLYSLCREAYETGMPMLRPMPLVFPQDPESNNLLKQYLLGPSLLAACFTDQVYVPAGKWYDYWTGQVHEGAGWHHPVLPENRGGPLLVPAGAILPLGPAVDYVGQRPDDELTVDFFLGADGEFTLYEDDGLTPAYEQGEFRKTLLSQREVDGATQLKIAAAEGDFPGAVKERDLTVRLWGLAENAQISHEGALLTEGVDWTWEEDGKMAVVALGRKAVAESTVLVIRV